jgi:alkanesulfonate monooxygenase SsuD/methylene tetrahydromethanopterin reductase-like flavin-dependent oxidoreductase (luciferase family)
MNLGCYIGADAKHAARNREQFDRHEIRKEGALLGTPIEALEAIAAYEAAGVDLINLTFRQQIDWDGLDCFIEEILPRFQ